MRIMKAILVGFVAAVILAALRILLMVLQG